MTDEETLAYLQQLQRERSRLEARMTRAMAHFHELRRPIANAKYAADEIAAALTWSTYTASGVLGTAVALMERLPDTVSAVESGQLDMTKARAILEWTETLSTEQARDVAEKVHDWSVGRTAARDHMCKNLTESAFRSMRSESLSNPHHRRSEGTFHVSTPTRNDLCRWIQA